MLDLTRYRIVDLSEEVRPGVEKLDGTYHWGNQLRKFQIRQFVAPGADYMYWIEAETHVGTHVELPAHMDPDQGASATEMPLTSFMGEAILLKFDSLEHEPGRRPLIQTSHLEKVRPHDIVLMWSPFSGAETPLLPADVAQYLAQLPIKMLGIQGIIEQAHQAFLAKKGLGIPIIDRMAHLEDLHKERFFFIGLPLRIAELDSSWIRAIALEPLD